MLSHRYIIPETPKRKKAKDAPQPLSARKGSGSVSDAMELDAPAELSDDEGLSAIAEEAEDDQTFRPDDGFEPIYEVPDACKYHLSPFFLLLMMYAAAHESNDENARASRNSAPAESPQKRRLQDRSPSVCVI
jgi:hypothetical protein